jgi:23S rRNA pseudouridine2605 synthase
VPDRSPRARARAPAPRSEPARERLQKVLADRGLASRRDAERWIREGRVRVNGQAPVLGARVGPRDVITVDGRPIARRRAGAPSCRVIIYHKTEGEVATRRDPEGRPTVFERLPRGRWVAVGRLDVNTTGLLLFTNDGTLAEALMHPRTGVEREYAVRVYGEVPADALVRLERGVELEDGPARFDRIADRGGEGRNHWYHVVIREGRQREVRRLWESQGVRVSRLIRVRYGPVALPRRLRAGRWEELDPTAVAALRSAAGLEEPPPRPARPHRPRSRRRA